MNIDILLEKINLSYHDRIDYHLNSFLNQAGLNADDYILCTSHFKLEPEEMEKILVPEKILENDLSIKEKKNPGGILAFPSQGIFQFKEYPNFKYVNFRTDKMVPVVVECLMLPVNSEEKEFLHWLVKKVAEFEKKKRAYKKEKKNYIDRLFLSGNIKDDLVSKIQSFFENRDFYIEHKLPWKLGILLYGPTGNGKTLLIKSISEYFGIKANDLITSIRDRHLNLVKDQDSTVFLGRRECYEVAYNSLMPEIYYLEDIDKRVFSQKGSDIPMLPMNVLLQTLDGVDELNNAIVIATTNYIKDLVDAIVARPGRFDIVQEIDNPSKEQIKKLFKYYNFKCGDLDNFIEDYLKDCSMAFAENFIKNCIFKYKRSDFKDTSEIKNVIDDMQKHLKLRQDLDGKVGFK